jgi:hypothetical protein
MDSLSSCRETYRTFVKGAIAQEQDRVSAWRESDYRSGAIFFHSPVAPPTRKRTFDTPAKVERRTDPTFAGQRRRLKTSER